MKMRRIYENEKINYYLIDNDKSMKIEKFEKDKNKNLVAVLPENSINKKYYNLRKMIENDLDEIEISPNSIHHSDNISKNNISKIEKYFDEIEKFIDKNDAEIFNKLKEKSIKNFNRKSLEIEIENQRRIYEEMMKKLEELNN